MTVRPLRRTLLVSTALVRGSLTEEGWSVGTAAGGRSALDVPRAAQPLDRTVT